MKQQLFNYFSENHDLILPENEQQTVIDMVLDEGDTRGWTKKVEKGKPVLCVVWNEGDDLSEGITLANVVSLEGDKYYINNLGAWYDYAEPVSDALTSSYHKWVNWIK